jgi:SEC-C motif-containing protein
MIACPCCSGITYAECCEPIIERESASTALALMRSRFTAFCIRKAIYLYNTTHAKTRLKTSLKEIDEWSKENTWTKLEIIKVDKGAKNDSSGFVEFKAHFTDINGMHQIHHEKSSFLKEGKKWFYYDGIINPQKPVFSQTISRNAPCICGSGRKYKNCCG